MNKMMPVLLILIAVFAAFVFSTIYKSQSVKKSTTIESVVPTSEAMPTLLPTATPAQELAVLVEQIPVSITSPTDGSTVATPIVVIHGKTAPLAEVSVNDSETRADKNGNFSASVSLDEGENTVVVAANDSDGSYAEQEFTMTYDSGK